MRVTIIILLALSLSSGELLAQDTQYPPIKYTVRVSFLTGSAVSDIPDGYITDDLLYYEKKTLTGIVISGSYFFNDWGVETSLFSLGDFYGRHHRFDKAIKTSYSDYYVFPVDNSYSPTSTYLKFCLGPVYKWEYGRWLLIGRFQIGMSVIQTRSEYINLKQIGTNERINLAFVTAEKSVKPFVVNPSFTAAYRIFNRVAITADLNYSAFNMDVTYAAKTTTYQPESVTTVERYRYKKLVSEITFGAGIIFTPYRKSVSQ